MKQFKFCNECEESTLLQTIEDSMQQSTTCPVCGPRLFSFSFAEKTCITNEAIELLDFVSQKF